MHSSTQAFSSQEQWRVGIGSRCITPQEPIWLMGYAAEKRFQPSIGVLDDLYARAMALEDADGTQAVIITTDLCVLRHPLADRIIDTIFQKTGIDRERIMLNSSHTHSAPVLDQEDVKNRFPFTEEAWDTICRYTETLPGLIAEAAAAAIANFAPARLAWCCGRADFVANRRKLDANGNWIGLGASEGGPVDDTVPVMRVETPDGDLRAVIFGCACHNVTLDPNNLLISADYAGFARETIEHDHPGVTALYLAGCGADANLTPRGGTRQWLHVRRHGQNLGAEVGRVLRKSAFTAITGPLRTRAQTVALPLESNVSREELKRRADGPDWQNLNAKAMLQMLDDNKPLPEYYNAPVSLWRFGDTLDLVGLPGEVTSGYAFRTAEVLPNGRAWVTGYTHEAFGYLPTARILQEGGYETRGLLPPGVGYFAPDVEESVVDALMQLRDELKTS